MRAILAALAGLVALPAQAECRLALALAVDVSRSVDAADYAIQQGGIAAALRDEGVRSAFLTGAPVALAVYEWSGRDAQAVIVDWRMIGGPGDLESVARQVEARAPPPVRLATALGRALLYGRDVMADAPDCAARVLDLSGDGRNNEGYDPAEAYARADFGDLTVNALAIGEHERDLVAYFRAEVIRGPGAFVEVAPTQSDFPAAIRRKLIRELTQAMLGALDADAAGPYAAD